MKIEQTELDCATVTRWTRSPLAQLLLSEEREALAHLTRDIFGYFLVQSSIFEDQLEHLSACAVKSKILLSPCADAPGAHTQAEALPIATDSLDALLLLHTLDFSSDPKQVLREADRVLIPEGRIIIAGINPFSLWGLRRWLPFPNRRFPWHGEGISVRRLSDWLSLLGFDLESVERRIYHPPIGRWGFIEKLQFIEKLGSLLWPWGGGVYIIRAVKRVSTVTPVGEKWHFKRSVGNSITEPTTRLRRTKNG